jgi:hypothetical protein
VFLLSFASQFLRLSERTRVHHETYLWMSWALSAVYDVVGALWVVIVASSYVELRRVREGPPEQELAEVFA